jgi:hypothetical protein
MIAEMVTCNNDCNCKTIPLEGSGTTYYSVRYFGGGQLKLQLQQQKYAYLPHSLLIVGYCLDDTLIIETESYITHTLYLLFESSI